MVWLPGQWLSGVLDVAGCQQIENAGIRTHVLWYCPARGNELALRQGHSVVGYNRSAAGSAHGNVLFPVSSRGLIILYKWCFLSNLEWIGDIALLVAVRILRIDLFDKQIGNVTLAVCCTPGDVVVASYTHAGNSCPHIARLK